MLGSANKLKTARKISMSGAVSGSGNFDGSGNVNIVTTQANIAVLTATVNTPAAGNSALNVTTTIQYPQGFNRNNCIIISLMSYNTANSSRGYCTVGATGVSAEEAKGNYGLQAQLGDEGIISQVFKINTNADTKTISIRIVLMKIN